MIIRKKQSIQATDSNKINGSGLKKGTLFKLEKSLLNRFISLSVFNAPFITALVVQARITNTWPMKNGSTSQRKMPSWTKLLNRLIPS